MINIQIKQNFQNTLDIIPNGILLIDIKTQKIEYANAEMKKIVGCPQNSDDKNTLDEKEC